MPSGRKKQNELPEDFRRIRKAVWRDWKRRAHDKKFVWETARLKWHLTLAFERNPQAVRSFFNPTFVPAGYSATEIEKRIKQTHDKETQSILRSYIHYVLRFGVAMRLHKAAPYFRTVGLTGDPATKFHVKVVGSHFEPADGWWDDGQTEVAEFFGSDFVEVGSSMQRLMEAGKANFLQIEDRNRDSLLNQLMGFAYSPDILTFVVLAAEQPYVFCLIGENVSVEKTWHEAGKVVSEFQKRLHGRTRAGRPTDLRKLRKKLAVLLRGKERPKQMAVSLAVGETEKDVYSMMSTMSQIKSKLRL